MEYVDDYRVGMRREAALPSMIPRWPTLLSIACSTAPMNGA